jgi:hypothetical protein
MIAAGSRLTDVQVGPSPHRVQRAGALIGARPQARKRAFFGHHVIAAALLLVAATLPARAQDTCSAAFALWVKLSESRIRKPDGDQAVDKSAGPQGTCIAGEPQRQELLRALASVRDQCQASTAAETEHVKMMIGINEGFIGSVALCPSEAPPKVVTKAERAPAAPQPRPEAPHKAVAKAEGAPTALQARPRACLRVARQAVDRYAVVNTQCSGTRVLAIIETQAPSGTIACKAYTVETSIAVLGKNPLTLNFECALDQKKCTRERVAAMFPECDW